MSPDIPLNFIGSFFGPLKIHYLIIRCVYKYEGTRSVVFNNPIFICAGLKGKKEELIMEKAIERQRVLLEHLQPIRSSSITVSPPFFFLCNS